MQALPSVRHAFESGAHVPPVHVWLQHDAFVEHGWLSEMQPPVVDVVVLTGVVVVLVVVPAGATGAQTRDAGFAVAVCVPN